MDLFFEKDRKKEKQYKTGYVMSAGIKRPFKFNKLSRKDIARLEGLDIHIDQESFTIMTTSSHNFTTDDNLIIDGYRYHISYMYEEDDDNENNVFNITCATKKYLILIADR